MGYATFQIIDSTTTGTIAAGAKAITVKVMSGTPVFNGVTLATDTPQFTVEAASGVFAAIAYNATGARLFITVSRFAS